MGHKSVVSSHPKSTGILRLTGCQRDPRIWGVTNQAKTQMNTKCLQKSLFYSEEWALNIKRMKSWRFGLEKT